MYSIIKDIFFNKGYCGEDIPASESSKKIFKKLEELEYKIKKYLPEDEKEKILFDYAFLHGELNSETERTSFAQGFKTGLLLGAEVFSDINKND